MDKQSRLVRSLVGFVAIFFSLLFIVIQVQATEIPFGSKNIFETNYDGAYSVFLEDIDGDGDQDVVGSARFDGDVSWWENVNGDGSVWVKHTIDSNIPDSGMVNAADIDNDGDIDIVSTAFGLSDKVFWWENLSGDGSSWFKHTIVSGYNGAVGLAVADVDQDGDQDVLTTAWNENEITWWENITGDGSTWFEHTISDSFVDAYFVETADVDSDGDLDILGAARAGNEIAWWENSSGDGSTFLYHTIDDSFGSPRMVRGADIDQDGDTDIIAASFDDQEISWWENINGDGLQWVKNTIYYPQVGFDL